jgi:cell division protein FtsB
VFRKPVREDRVRDIGSRLQRYRLSRYADPESVRRWRIARWLLPAAGLWLLYAGVLSEHSLLRLWQLDRAQSRTARQLEVTQAEIERLDGQLNDPAKRRELQERVLRERNGFARPGEIVYRIEGGRVDTVSH